MTIADAIRATGTIPPLTAPQATKKRYSEMLSAHLAQSVAEGLRNVGFAGTRPVPGGPGETTFQGGLGPKQVDVSYSDEQHGLLFAVSIKTINFPPYGKNLKNRFGDLCTEAITLHLRFPYAVVCGLLCMPFGSDEDAKQPGRLSTFQRATHLFATISGRRDYTDPGEKFETFTMMLFRPLQNPDDTPDFTLMDACTRRPVAEGEYYQTLRQLNNLRNPHALIGEPDEGEG